jgi:2-aminoadipate transaminase
MLEEYGRSGGFERHLPAARELYAGHWAALAEGLARHMPDGVAWTEPTGGFLTWLTLPEGLDSTALRPDAIAAGVAYVPGAPFFAGDAGARTLRLSFSHLSEPELATAAERLGGVVRAALDRVPTHTPGGLGSRRTTPTGRHRRCAAGSRRPRWGSSP